MVSEKLELNFPLNGGNVFDKNNNEQFFVYCGSFSNTTDNIEDFSVDQLETKIPIGYKSVIKCKRVKIIDNGKMLKEWCFENSGKLILLSDKGYKLYVQSWKREIETTTIYKPNHFDLSINSSMWDNLDDCYNYSLEFSRLHECKIIISHVLEVINWH